VLESTTLLALVLIVGSAGCHATWNLLLKKAGNQEVFVWWLSAFVVIPALPIAAFLASSNRVEAVGIWYVIGSSLLHICYFLFLGRSLARSDLSLAYPIARGFGPGLVPVLAVSTLGETVQPSAWVGIVCIVGGIYAMAWWGQLSWSQISSWRMRGTSGVVYALLTGGCIALYTIVDKQGVAYISPFLYLYLVTCGVAMGILPYVLRNYGYRGLVAELRSAPWSIPVAAGLVFLAYGLVLTAMTFADASYVAPAREMGLLFGVALGALVLKEQINTGRIAGTALMIAGLTLITIVQ
jgi:drug/metabolite transporter (DMT)-like permease